MMLIERILEKIAIVDLATIFYAVQSAEHNLKIVFDLKDKKDLKSLFS